MKHAIAHFDYHVVDACNLACEFCTHYSNFKGPANIQSPEAIAAEWASWQGVIEPERVHLIGGEPLLNPRIVEIVRLAFDMWPNSTICLYSNGLLLKKYPELREALKGGRYVLGLHYCDHRDVETERLAKEFFGSDVAVDVVNGALEWLQFYKLNEGVPVPYADGNPRASWENCIAGQSRCFVMRDGRLWKCPQVAFADRAGVASWFGGYKSCGPNGDVESWLKAEEEDCCSNCPASRQITNHGADYMKLRLPVIS